MAQLLQHGWWDRYFLLLPCCRLEVCLRGIDLRDADVTSFLEAFRNFVSREVPVETPASIYLDVSENDLTDIGGVALISGLHGIGRLCALKMCKNRVGNTTAECLAQFLQLQRDAVKKFTSLTTQLVLVDWQHCYLPLRNTRGAPIQ